MEKKRKHKRTWAHEVVLLSHRISEIKIWLREMFNITFVSTIFSMHRSDAEESSPNVVSSRVLLVETLSALHPTYPGSVFRGTSRTCPLTDSTTEIYVLSHPSDLIYQSWWNSRAAYSDSLLASFYFHFLLFTVKNSLNIHCIHLQLKTLFNVSNSEERMGFSSELSKVLCTNSLHTSSKPWVPTSNYETDKSAENFFWEFPARKRTLW